MERIKEALLPISSEQQDILEELVVQLYNARFSSDFGRFVAGENYEILVIDFLIGEIRSVDPKGDCLKRQAFRCFPL